MIDVGITTIMGSAYLTAEFGFNAELSPDACRWCRVNGFDASARDALRWNDPALAGSGWVTAPVATTGLMLLAGGSRGVRRHFDDVVPVLQAAIATSVLQHVMKLAAGRQRPYAHFAAPGTLTASEEDNVSFWSGHTSLCFSLLVFAGTVASRRGYRLAPVIWTTRLALRVTPGYLRISTDRHYTTDVLVGAAVGSLMGYVWPRFMHRHLWRDVEVVPTATGVAVMGSF